MRAKIIAGAILAAVIAALAANAQQTGPGPKSVRYFSTPLEKDPSREVRLQQQYHNPGPGTAYHTHPGDQWEVVLESVYIPRGTIHRNENQSGKQTRTLELLIVEKDKPQRVDAPK
jgi:hypothetical protein